MNSDQFNNISLLEEENLPKGHLLRFEKKLDSEFHKIKPFQRRKVLLIAASILLLISSSIALYLNFEYNQSSHLLLANYSPDLAEAESYYNTVLNTKIETIHSRNYIDSDFKVEIREFRKTLQTISSDMKQNPGDERLEDAFFGLYQTQIEVLDNIIEHNR